MMFTSVLSQKVLTTFPFQYLLNHSHQNKYFLLFMSMIFGYDNFTVRLENSGNLYAIRENIFCCLTL